MQDLLLSFASPSTSWATTFVLASVVFYAYRVLTRSRFHHPPGPKPAPFIGNVAQLPKEHLEERFAEWGHTYGALNAFRPASSND